ncbi:MAG: hypothetical protein P4K86_04255 [Terracidiphilus sp.]|nr:hypothetical protein [Terracidiphilus sp.]
MNRPVLVCALFIAAAAAMGAQEASQSSPYQGTANPPADDEILTSSPSEAKPPAGTPAYVQPTTSRAVQAEPRPSSVDPAVNFPAPGSDDGIVQVAKPARVSSEPALTARAAAYDPDGDIVHPRPLRPGELAEGTSIRVRLLSRLSSAASEKGETFRTKVASDVLQGGQVLIPAGAEIDGSVVEVSGGHFGGHGTMRLRPDTVILPSGMRYRLHAYLTATPGAKTRVGSEGGIDPGSRTKRDTVEYGGAVGAGATTGAILGGPVGALTGGIIGAGVVTAHLLISHPQATLETGTVIVFTLSEPLSMVPSGSGGE